MKSIFASNGGKRCENCFFCAFDAEANKLLCEKKGLVDRGGRCFRYRYDPFKRMPKSTPAIIKPDAAEFSLDTDDGKED